MRVRPGVVQGAAAALLGGLLALPSLAAGPKSGGSHLVVDDLVGAAAGAVQAAGGNYTLDGAISPVAASKADMSIFPFGTLEAGFFSALTTTPVSSSFLPVSTRTVTVQWDASNPTGTLYTIQASTASNFTGVVYTSTVTNSSYTTIGALTPKTVYHLRYKASYMEGDETAYHPLGSTRTLSHLPLECDDGFTVNPDGSADHITIGAAVAALPDTLTGPTCIVLAPEVYTEVVRVDGFQPAGSSLTFRPALYTGPRPIVQTPSAVNAVFDIRSASVSIRGLDVVVNLGATYGIIASSGWVTISSVVVMNALPSGITDYGVKMSSWSLIEYSSVTVASGGVAGALELSADGDFTTVRYSTFANATNGRATLHLSGASTVTLTGVYAENRVGVGGVALNLVSGADWTRVYASTFVSEGVGLETVSVYTSSNTFTDLWVQGPATAMAIHGGRFNNVDRSTIIATGGTTALRLTLATSSNTITGSYVQASGGNAVLIDSLSHYNAFYGSTVTNNSPTPTLYLTGGSSNVFSGGYVRNQSGQGIRIEAASPYTQVLGSTVTSMFGTALEVNSDWNAISDSYIETAGASAVAFYMAGHHNTVAQTTIASTNGGYVMQMAGASTNTVTGVQGLGTGFGLSLESGAYGNTVTYSTFTGGSAPGAYLSFASSNSFTAVYAQSASSDAMRLDPGSHGNTIARSTFGVTITNGVRALRFSGASSNTVTGSLLSATGLSQIALQVEGGAWGNEFSSSTINSLDSRAANFFQASSHTIRNSTLWAPNKNALVIGSAELMTIEKSVVTGGSGFSIVSLNQVVDSRFDGVTAAACAGTCFDATNSRGLSVTRSTFSAAGAGYRAFRLSNTSMTAVSQSVFTSTGSYAIALEFGSSENTFTSVIASASILGSEAVFLNQSSSNVFTGSKILNTLGRGMYIGNSSHWTSVEGSTIAGLGEGIRIDTASGTRVSTSYIEGSTAAFVASSYNTDFFANDFAGGAGLSSSGCAIGLNFSGQVNIASNTVLSSGNGVCIDQNNRGVVTVAANTIRARASGVTSFGTQQPGTEIWIASNTILPQNAPGNAWGVYLDGLSPGATVYNNSIYFRSAMGAAGATYGGMRFNSSGGLRVERNRINIPDVLSGGGSITGVDTAMSNLSFRYNDVHIVSLAGIANVRVVHARAGGIVDLRYNIFSSSAANAGFSVMTHFEGGSLASDYNLFHSSAGAPVFQDFASPRSFSQWTVSPGIDRNSGVGHPLWAGVTPFNEDFHVKSMGGRCVDPPTCSVFVPDALNSASLDRADSSAPFAAEPDPDGYLANLGSTGGTAEASRSPTTTCAVQRTVCQDGSCGATSIQGAIDTVPKVLPGDACVLIRSSGPYATNLRVGDFIPGAFRLSVGVDVAFTTYAVINSTGGPGLNALLDIRSASVTVSGLQLRTNAMASTHGVYVASHSVNLSDIVIFDPMGDINEAGVALSTENSIVNSSITVGDMNAAAIVASGTHITLRDSSFGSTMSGGASPLVARFLDVSSSTFSGLYIWGSDHVGARFTNARNIDMSGSTIAVNGGSLTLELIGVSSFSLRQAVVVGGDQAISISSLSAGVLIDRSSITAMPGVVGTPGLFIEGADVTVSNSRIAVGSTFASNDGIWVRALRTTLDGVVLAVSGTGTALNVSGSTSTTVTSSFVESDRGRAIWLHPDGGQHVVSFSTITSRLQSSDSTFEVLGSTLTTLTDSYVANLGISGGGASYSGGAQHTVTRSTFIVLGGGGNEWGLELVNSSSNTLADLLIGAQGAGGLLLSATAPNYFSSSTVDRATISASGAGSVGFKMSNSSMNAVSGLVVYSAQSYGGVLDLSTQNVISASSFSARDSGFAGLLLGGSSSNTLTGLYVSGGFGNGLKVDSQSHYNAISYSTAVSGGPNPAYFVQSSLQNVFSAGVIRSTAGAVAAHFLGASDDGAIEDSVVTALGGAGEAVRTDAGASGIRVTGSRLSAPGNAVRLNGPGSLISASTITAGGSGILIQGTANEVSASYVQGSTAVHTLGAVDARVSGSVLVSTAAGGAAVFSESVTGLMLSSNTIKGPSLGAGVTLGASNDGLLYFTSNTFSSGPLRLFATGGQNAGARVWVTTNTFYPTVSASTHTVGLRFEGLSQGATVWNNDIHYPNAGTLPSGVNAYGLYAANTPGLLVAHNRYNGGADLGAGGALPFAFYNADYVTFAYNDVWSQELLNQTGQLILLAESTDFRMTGNILVNAMTAAGGPVIVNVSDVNSRTNFASDYNDLVPWAPFSQVGKWGTPAAQDLMAWRGNLPGLDANSISADPLWKSSATSDFHPLSANGRYDPASQAFVVVDLMTSPTIDKADPAAAIGGEAAPGDNRANLGSYGQTSQASKAGPPAGCAVEISVPPALSIAEALSLVTSPLVVDTCIVLRQPLIYESNVNISGIDTATNNKRLTIMGEPGITVVVDPVGSSGAGITVNVGSVTLHGFTIAPSGSIPNGVRVTSASAVISSMTILGQNIASTALSVTTGSLVTASSITASYVALRVSGVGASVIGSTATTTAVSSAALRLDGAVDATLTGVYVGASASTAAVLAGNTLRASITGSTFTSATGPAFHASSASGTVLSDSFLVSPQAAALRFGAAAYNNTVTGSTITTAGPDPAAIFSGGSSNTVTLSYLEQKGTSVTVHLAAGARSNTLSSMTLVGYNSAPVIESVGSSSNTFAHLSIYNATGRALYLNGGSNDNRIEYSSLIADGASSNALEIDASSRNVVSRSFLDGQNSAFVLLTGAQRNVLDLSTATSVDQPSVYVASSDSATVSRSFVQQTGGNIGMYGTSANNLAVTQSTVSALSAGTAGIFIVGGTNVSVRDSYVEGGRAVTMTGIVNTDLLTSSLYALRVDEPAVYINGGSSGLRLSSSVVQGGRMSVAPFLFSAGLFVDAASAGQISVTTNVFLSGSRFNVYIGTLAAGARVHIASNTIHPSVSNFSETYGIKLDGLTTGATLQNNSILSRDGGANGNPGSVAFGIYALQSDGLLIERNRVNQPGLIDPGGRFVGVGMNLTPRAFVRFNDVHVEGDLTFGAAFAASNSTGIVLTNNALSVDMIGGTNHVLDFDAATAAGISLGYNVYHSSTGPAGASVQFVTDTFPFGFGGDSGSISVIPHWPSVLPGSEEFHPRSHAGRYNPASGAHDITDDWTSGTLDRADPNVLLVGLEPVAANGGRANIGSYGGTPEASLTPAAPSAPMFASVGSSSVTIAYGTASAPNYTVAASTSSNFSGVIISSMGPAGELDLAVAGLSVNTTYYFITAANWGDAFVQAAGGPLSTATLSLPPAIVSPGFTEAFRSSATLVWGVSGNPVGVTTYTVAFTTSATFPNTNDGNVYGTSRPYVSTGERTLTGLTPNTTYYGFVASLNHTGAVSGYTLAGTTSTRVEDPGPLSLGAVTDTTVGLLWPSGGNPLSLTTYTVITSTASDFTGASTFAVSSAPVFGPSLVISGLTPASTYSFLLMAVNHDGSTSAPVALLNRVTLPLTIQTPTPLTVIAGSTLSLTASWGLSGGATGYTLVASTMSVNPPVDVTTSVVVTGQASSNASVQGLTPNTAYFLFVRANGQNGNSLYAVAADTATHPAVPQSAITTFTSVAQSSFTVSWLAAGNPLAMTTYTVVLSTRADFDSSAASLIYSTVPAAGPQYTYTGLSPYTEYFAQVRALGQGVGVTPFISLGSTRTLPVSLDQPTGFVYAVATTSATADWLAVPGATGYSLVASPNVADPPNPVVWVSSLAGAGNTSGAVFGLSPLTTYYLFVRAEGPGNSGPYTVSVATATDPVAPSSATPSFSAFGPGAFTAHWTTAENPVGIATYTIVVSTYGTFPNTAGFNKNFTQVSAGATGLQAFAGLEPNTTYHSFVDAHSHAGTRVGAVVGSAATYANDPLPGAPPILSNGVSSVTVQWVTAGNPAITSYTVVASTAADFNSSASSVTFTTASVSGVATVSGLAFGTTWFFQVAAVNHAGQYTAFADLTSTVTFLSNTIPLIVDNQSGDDVWRRTDPGAVYDLDFVDGSLVPPGLDRVHMSVSTSPGGSGSLVAFSTSVAGINATSYSAPLVLPPGAFAAMIEGATNYVTVRVFNQVTTNTLVDAFYVRKDTTAPHFLNAEAGGDPVVQSAAGRVYDVRPRDAASGLAAFEYSVSLTPGSADAAFLPWTPVTVLSGATFYDTAWPVDFAALRDGVTNYVSVRASDLAGATSTYIDAFRVLKDTSGPTVAISSPSVGSGFVSAVTAVSGSVVGGFGVSGASVAVQHVGSGQYWDGAAFVFATPVWIAATGTSSWTVAALGVTFLEGNTYRLIARGSTPYGQFSTRFATVTFNIDSIAPSVAVTSPTALATVASIPQLSGTAADAGSGVSFTEVRLRRNTDGRWWRWDNDTWSVTPVSSITTGGTSWSVTPSALLQANMITGTSYYIAVRASDNSSPANAGDFFAAGSTFTFSDPTPPAAIADLVAVNGPLPGDVRLTWTAAGAHGNNGVTLSGQYAIFYSTDFAAVPSTASAQVFFFSTMTVIPGSFQGFIGGNGTLSAGVTYFIAVAMSNADGNWSLFSNQASSTATPSPSDAILGHVVNASTQGITAVRIDAFDATGVLVATAFTLADGSGTFSVNGLSAGNYKIEASWTANGITSSVWIDGIPMGSVNIDFSLDLNYALATLTGTLGALSSSGQAGLGVAGAGHRPSLTGSHVELFQGGREVARVNPDPTGRWTIGHLLPGSYAVRAYTGLGYTDFQDIDLAEGEIRTVGFIFNPLPDASVFAFPNPARTATTLRFETALQPLEAQIAIFDLKGALVREVPGNQITATATPGLYHYVWDLTNSRGQPVASGVYLFMVKVKGGSENQLVKSIKKVAVVR